MYQELCELTNSLKTTAILKRSKYFGRYGIVLRTKNKVSAKFVCRCHVPCALHLHAANELISLRMYVYSSIRATTTAGIWRNVRK